MCLCVCGIPCSGDKITVKAGSATANVIQSDIPAGQAVIQIIDNVSMMCVCVCVCVCHMHTQAQTWPHLGHTGLYCDNRCWLLQHGRPSACSAPSRCAVSHSCACVLCLCVYVCECRCWLPPPKRARSRSPQAYPIKRAYLPTSCICSSLPILHIPALLRPLTYSRRYALLVADHVVADLPSSL